MLKGDREPCVAGSFYPASKIELRKEMIRLFGTTRVNHDKRVRAIIVPHAGYIYSGEVAAAAYQSINETQVFDNIFIIGSSHRVLFNGASVYSSGDYLTPLGRVEVNREIAGQLLKHDHIFCNYPPAHKDEHSIEVQLPFIQQKFGGKIKIVPIIIGTTEKSDCSKIADTLKPWFIKSNLFIISSDFSHYPSYSDATSIDKATADALMSGSRERFTLEISKKSDKDITNLSTRMCGWSSALTLLSLAEIDNKLEFNHITYRNSGDSKFGDHNRVVGYHAISLVEPAENQDTTNSDSVAGFILNDEEKLTLLELARESIESHLLKESVTVTDKYLRSDTLMMDLGAFVTILQKGKLRGCIGRFMPSQPLWEVVREVARAAAFNDTRFTPITKEDLPSIQVEISVLTPLKRIKSIEEIELGKHGVYIKRESCSGTFLPKVAENKNWSVEEFLGRISRDKAGLGWSGWKEAEIYIYEALTFDDK